MIIRRPLLLALALVLLLQAVHSVRSPDHDGSLVGQKLAEGRTAHNSILLADTFTKVGAGRDQTATGGGSLDSSQLNTSSDADSDTDSGT